MGIPLRALIVEDSEDDTLLLVHELRRGGYEPVYQRVDSLKTMKAALEKQPWDIVLSDYTMPGFRGTDALLLLRERDPDTPFIYVSGTIGEDMAVAAMKAGANDYVLKGNLKRLIPAVQRELRDVEMRRQRKRAEEERLRLAAIVESSDDAILDLTFDGIIVNWNSAAQRIYGYSADEVKGRPITITVPPDRTDEARQILERLKRGEHIDHFETIRLRKDGQKVHLSMSISPIKDAAGNIIGASSIARDIGERKRAEEVLNEIYVKEIQHRRSKVVRDLGVIFALSIVVLLAAHYFDVFEKVSAWALKYRGAAVDELITAFVFLAFAFAFFSYRKWMEVKAEVFGRQQIEAALRTLHGELEMRVQERTTDLAKSNEALQTEAVQRTRAQEQAQRNLERIQALHEIDLAITSTLDLRTILDILLEKTDRLLPFVAATTVRLLNRESGELEPVACRNVDEKEWKAATAGMSIKGLARVLPEKSAPIMTLNAQTDPRSLAPDFLRKCGLVSSLRVPLVAKDDVLGALTFFTKEEHQFTNEEVEFLTTLAGQAAIAINNSQLYEEISRSRKELELTNQYLERSLGQLSGLYTALTPLTPSESTHQMMDGIIERLMEATGADAVLIRLRDNAIGALPIASQRGFPDHYLKSVEMIVPGSSADRVFRNGETIIAPDIVLEPRLKGKVQLQVGLRSCAMLPLKVFNEVRGIIHLASRKSGYFDEEQRDHLITITQQMGLALENKDHFENLRISRDALEKSNKVKDEFLSVMSHELRTPLNVVVGYAGMIKDGLLGEINLRQQEALEKMINRTNDQLVLVNNILYATVLETEKVNIDMHEVSVGDFLSNLKAAYEAPINKDFTLEWDYPADLPVVKTDSAKLKLIMQNLIDNAIKFTRKGNVTISANIRHEATGERQQEEGLLAPHASGLTPSDPHASRLSPHAFVEFKVADTGVGIPPDALPFIFEKFRQADSSETRLFGGVGMGLYIVKKFAELLKGKIGVETEPGKGSTFIVAIPY